MGSSGLKLIEGGEDVEESNELEKKEPDWEYLKTLRKKGSESTWRSLQD